MERFLVEATSTPGTNAKADLIRSASPRVHSALVMALNPFTPTFMKKLPKVDPPALGGLTFDQAYQDFCQLFYQLTTRKLTGNNAKDAVKRFLGQCNGIAQDVFSRIIKKDLKVGIGAKLVNTVLGHGFIPIFTVQLANKYDSEKKYKGVDHWWCSRKLNGLRGYWDIDGEVLEGVNVIRSREGHPFFGFGHVVSELAALAAEYDLQFIDGELFNRQIPFQRIQSFVRGNRNVSEKNKKKIFFNVFAIGGDEIKTTDDMINKLREIDWSKYEYLRPLEYFKVVNKPQLIEDFMLAMYKEGFEGLMLRHPDIPYEWKRSNQLLKYKPFHEADFIIEEVQLGEPDGRFANTCGTIVISGTVKWKVDGQYEERFVRCECGSGFSEFSLDRDGNKIAQKLDWDGGDWGWQEKPTRDWMYANRDRLKGLLAEIQFQTFSDEPNEDGVWALQFPTFRVLKLDRE